MIEIPALETGVIRVFAVNRNPHEMAQTFQEKDGAALVAEMLGQPLPEGGYELFPVKDLTGVGLKGYLQEGYAVPAEQLAAQRPRLDALEGYVLLVFSQAFGGQAGTLAPGPDLTLIGTFGEIQPDMRAKPMEAETARPATGTPQQRPADPPKGRAGSAMVIVAVVVLIVIAVIWGLF